MWGKEAFYVPMFRSQSFGKPVPLDCEIHQCLVFYVSLVEWDG